MKNNLINILVIVALGCAIYSNSLDAPFYLDDEVNITEDSTVNISDISFGSLYRAAFKGVHRDRPLAKLSFAMNYYFGGEDVVGYHLVNIAIHIISSILLYLFIAVTLINFSGPQRYAGRERLLAMLAAIMWMVSPVQVQSVTYIVQRMNSMAAMFFMLSFLLYIYGRLAPTRKSSVAFFAAGVFAWLLSLACKPIGVVLPFFIIFYEWCFFQGLNQRWLRKNSMFFLIPALVLIVLVFLYMGGDPVGRLLGAYSIRDFSLGERVLTEGRVVVFYLSLLLLPLPGRLNLEHDFAVSTSLVDPAATLFSIILLISLAAMAVVSLKKHRFLSFAIFWFLGGLVLESSVIGLELVFEHRLYLPSMLLPAIPILWLGKHVPRDRLILVVALIPVTLMGLVTYSRNSVWQDANVFLEDCARKSPGNARALNNLGNHRLSAGRFGEAETLFAKAIRLKPRNADTIYNMGNVLQRLGRNDQAIYYYNRVLSLTNDRHIGALNNLGIIYAESRQFGKARESFAKVITRRPNHEVALANLGRVLQDMGRFDEAIAHYNEALLVVPDSEDLKSGLIRAWQRKATQTGRRD